MKKMNILLPTELEEMVYQKVNWKFTIRQVK